MSYYIPYVIEQTGRGERSFDEIMALAADLQARMERGADRLPSECDLARVDDLLSAVAQTAGAAP